MLPVMRTAGSAWVGVLCFIAAFFVSMVLDRITPDLDPSKSRLRIFAEVCVQFGVIGAIVFLVRHVIKNVPFPADGMYGYKHLENGELRSLPLFVFIFMFFQKKTQAKMKHLST
jgi:cytosine/uracil/thiamine/allantoin permease